MSLKKLYLKFTIMVLFPSSIRTNPLERRYKHYITILKESISMIGNRNENIKFFLSGKPSFESLLSLIFSKGTSN